MTYKIADEVAPVFSGSPRRGPPPWDLGFASDLAKTRTHGSYSPPFQINKFYRLHDG